MLLSNRSLSSIPILTLIFLISSCSEDINGSGVNGADPGVLEAPIAFVKRPIPMNDDDEIQSDIREPLFFGAGGDVYIRSNSTVNAKETNITNSVTLGTGDVKGLSPSFDGTKLLFSLRLEDPNPNDDDIPAWNIYEYDLTDKLLTRVINDDLTAQNGDDLSPAYLPDGRIVFSSNRQRLSGEILTNEGKPRFRALDEDRDELASVLHVMNSDGSEIHQISFNPSHDLNPTILSNNYSGEILFTRWDNAGGNNAMDLYRTTPDGTQVNLVYGVHSHRTGVNNEKTDDETIQFTKPVEMQDGRIMAIARPYDNTFGAGDIVIIDIANYANFDQPIPSNAGLLQNTQQSATINNISTANEISLEGRYSAAYPLWDGSERILISKSNCELNVNEVSRPCIEPYLSDEDAEEASPIYSIWLYDTKSNSQKVVVLAEQNTVITDIVALQSKAFLPTLIADKTSGELDPTWLTDNVGAIHIKSVYDFGNSTFDGCFLNDCTDAASIDSVSDLGDPAQATADQRPARFVRFVKPVSLPDRNDPNLENPPNLSGSAFGPRRNQGMREIIGYAPVAPDGSVKVKLPADVPLAISILDKRGRRIGPRHENWFTVRAGDTLECLGCHTEQTTGGATPIIHGRADAEANSINTGIPSSGIFVNTQIPTTSDAYWGDLGDTMAEVRFERASSEPIITADIEYQDVWTDPAVRAADTAFSYTYANLDEALLSPANSNCESSDFRCRITINYPQHIHPIWSVARGVADAETCTNCHNPVDTDLMLNQVPAAQLDLTDGISDQNILRLKSYQELFATDQGQTIDAEGNLVNIQIENIIPILDGEGNPVLDVDDNPTFLIEFVDDPDARFFATMSGNGARASYFIEKMTETELESNRDLSTPASDPNYVDHSGFLSNDELKMISEWLDIGAQYFNDPFDPAVPQN